MLAYFLYDCCVFCLNLHGTTFSFFSFSRFLVITVDKRTYAHPGVDRILKGTIGIPGYLPYQLLQSEDVLQHVQEHHRIIDVIVVSRNSNKRYISLR